MTLDLNAPRASVTNVTTPPADAWPARVPSPAAAADFDLDRRLGVLSVALRWLTIAVGLVTAFERGGGDVPLVAALLSLTTFATWQTVQRPRLDPPERTLPYLVVIELLLATIAVSVTGGVRSPLVLTPAIAIVLAGYTFSERQVMAFAYGGLAAVAVLAFLGHVSSDTSQSIALLGAMYILCGALGAFTRRIAVDVARRHAEAADVVARMTRANELLVALHGLAQTLPASLDLTEVVASTRARLRTLFDSTVLVLFVRDPASGRWRAELAEGARIPGDLTTAELATPVLAALGAQEPRVIGDHLADRVRGVSPFARSGLYAALRSRGNLVGVLVVEHERPGAFGANEADLMTSIAGPVALALDNAVLFARLRILGAETERARIARDLHDQLAQSLVYVTFELERFAASSSPPAPEALAELHDFVHGMVSELRDTLADLRAAVTAGENLVTVAQRQLDRLAKRYALDIELTSRVRAELPLTVEQELWRILQEAVHNVARHARARHVDVRYEVSHSRAVLEVRDDGCGFDPSTISSERYGLVGMRERAAAIGGALTIDSAPGRGSVVRVDLEVPA
jgi:signal transduction histidine kinase